MTKGLSFPKSLHRTPTKIISFVERIWYLLLETIVVNMAHDLIVMIMVSCFYRYIEYTHSQGLHFSQHFLFQHNSFFLFSIVLPGEPSLRAVNEVKEKRISLSIRENESLQCYHSFTSGIKLQTRISYSSKWDMHPRVVRKTLGLVYSITLSQM